MQKNKNDLAEMTAVPDPAPDMGPGRPRNPNKGRVVSVRVPPDLLAKVDKRRGIKSRSRFLVDLIAKELKQ